MRHDLEISFVAIKDYQNQLRRNYVQSLDWENLIEKDFKKKTSDTAYLTVGKFFQYMYNQKFSIITFVMKINFSYIFCDEIPSETIS